MNHFEYVQPSTPSRAIAFLKEPQSEALAGGTDLLGELKRGIRKPTRLVNLKNLREWGEIRHEEGKGIRIGALVLLAEIESHPVIREKFGILAQAASLAATPQLRNMGTVGGNLCQHPRCWYFRNPLFPCWLKGGQRCFAVQGENRYHAILGRGMCQAVLPSDLAPALVALEARVRIISSRKEREIPLEEMYTKPTADHRQMTVLKPGDLISEVTIPNPADGSEGIYLKTMERKAWAFALVSLAAQLQWNRDQIVDGRLVLGSVAPVPWRAKEAEDILRGQKLSPEILRRAGEAAVAAAKPLRDNEYKIQLVKGLFGRLGDRLANPKETV
jgi:xanthine dehydrogenase YagS FAD-binding subunit